MDTLLAVDQGTTGTTALVMDEKLNVIAEASEDFEQHFPKPGWVEHDPDQIWKTVESTVRKVTERVDKKKILAIGITNQRETVCFWERGTGRKLAPAIVWQDRRTQEFCEALKSRGTEPFFQEQTGLLLDPYFSGTKVQWALKHWGDVTQAQKNGSLCVGTIDSFLMARMSGGTAHKTEVSNASRTLAFNISKLKWDPELCLALQVPQEIWPEVRPSSGTFTATRGFADLPDGIPISGCLGDQQAALLGQACIEEGLAKCTYGTGAFILMNTGAKKIKSRHRLLTTIAWKMSDAEPCTYALEGSAFVAGAAVQWLRDGLKMISSASEIEALASSVPDSQGVVFVPALTGLGAPYWNPEATGLFTGITRGTQRGHIARAVLDGIAYQIADILLAMEKDLGKKQTGLNVDGGAAANNLLMQIQSNLLQTRLTRPKMLETTSLGAIFAAGLGVGVWKSLSDVKASWVADRTFFPAISEKEREAAMQVWGAAVAKVNLKK